MRLFAGPDQEALDFVKSHATKVGDLMSAPAITVEEGAPLADIADLLERRRIRRVPVIRAGRLVGIVSRADLLRGLVAAAASTAPVSADDETIRTRILQEIEGQHWAAGTSINVIVKDGVAHLWGMAHSEAERKALRTAAEGVPGVRRVEDKLFYLPASYGGA